MPLPGGIFTKPSEFQIDVASTSITDTGIYVITMTVSDNFTSSFTSTFTLNITNAAPRVANVPPDVSVFFGKSLNIALSSYFSDDDGDLLTLTAKYSFNGGAEIAIPGGIFTKPS